MMLKKPGLYPPGVSGADRRRRYRKVGSALTRHGLGAVAAALRLAWPRPLKLVAGGGAAANGATAAAHVRMAVEEMGTTAIKLGQILSTRPDLIGPDLESELEKLRDQVPPVPFEAILATVERELGCPHDEVFQYFSEVPLAAASIGQVHEATLRDGTSVVVKVRKPGVDEEVNVDLSILSDLARRAAEARVFGTTYDIEAIASDFAWTLRSELDYVREGKNADRLRQVLAGTPGVVVPRIHWEHTTAAVLVMERLEGTPIADFIRTSDDVVLKRKLARDNAEALMTEVFEAGFFHADPHPGNFLVLHDGRLGLLDFGMVGQLEEDERIGLLKLLMAIVDQDSAGIADCLDDLGIIRSSSDRDGVRRDAQHLLNRYFGVPVDQFPISDYINDVLAIVRRQGLQLPTDLALVLKTVAMSEGLWRQLDPKFDAATVAEPYVRSAASRLYSPRAWGGKVVRAAGDTLELGAELPGQVRRLARRLDRGDFEIALRHRDLEEALIRMQDMMTGLATAIVAAAFIMGVAVLSSVWEPPWWHIIAPVWFVLGLLVSGGLLMRLALTWAMGRRRR